MEIQKTPMHCMKCEHEWVGELIVHAPVEIATAVLKAIRCSECGASARQVAFGRGDVPNPEPVQSSDLTDDERRSAWLKLHDSGLSSKCIADVMCGSPTDGNYPYDGDDFGRCERLLILYPAWRERLGEMAKVNAVWAALVPRWAEIEAAYSVDLAAYRARKKNHVWLCYDLMRSIIGSVRQRAA